MGAQFQHHPRYAEVGLGGLLEALRFTKEEFRTLIASHTPPGTRVAHQGYHTKRARTLLTERCDFVRGDPKEGSLSLDINQLPELELETTRAITRLASIQWLAQINEEGRTMFIEETDEALPVEDQLTPDQKLLLNEILLRPGHKFSTNSKGATPDLNKLERREALKSLADKLNRHFGEGTITWPPAQNYFQASQDLIDSIPGLLIQDLIDTHEERFGAHLPITAYLLREDQKKAAAIEEALSSLRRHDRTLGATRRTQGQLEALTDSA